MAQDFPFLREDVFPSWFANRIQDYLSAAETNLRLTRKSATEVQVIPDPALGIAAVSMDGRWRFNEEAVTREHPGGAKATYVVWAIATDNDVDETPKPHSDHTDYSFELRITSGAEPSGVGVEVLVKIGEIDWSGTAIEALRQTLNSVTGPMLADSAVDSTTGDVTWTRAAGGGLIANLKTDSVGATELADNSVDTNAIVALAVTEAKIAALAITEGKLASNSVAAAKIVNLAVETAKLAALAVTEEKIGNEAVASGKIKNLAVTAAKLAAEAVETAKIKDLAVTDAKLASPNNAVWKIMVRGAGNLPAEAAIGSWYFPALPGNAMFNLPIALATNTPDAHWIDPGDLVVAGKTNNYRIRVECFTGATAPVSAFKYKLVRVNREGGNWVFSSAVEGEVERAAPAANTAFKDFVEYGNVITNSAHYVVQVNNVAKTAAAAPVFFRYSIYTRNA